MAEERALKRTWVLLVFATVTMAGPRGAVAGECADACMAGASPLSLYISHPKGVAHIIASAARAVSK